VRWAGQVSNRGSEEKFTQNFGGKPEGKRPIGNTINSWNDDSKMQLREIKLG
jgi:hypothetical protein